MWNELYECILKNTPLIYIQTEEVNRVETYVKSIVSTLRNCKYTPAAALPTVEAWTQPRQYSPPQQVIFIKAWNNTIFNISLERLQNLYHKTGLTVIIAGTKPIPTEYKQYIIQLILPPLTEQERKDIISQFINTTNVTKLIDATRNLTTCQIIGALTHAINPETKSVNIQKIYTYKNQIFNNQQLLTYIPTTIDMEQVGGLNNLKQWLCQTAKIYQNLDAARQYGIKHVKGMFLLGIPGTGKTLVAKMAATLLKLPLYQFNIQSVLHSLVGESEQYFYQALQTMDNLAPAVILCDEIEKAFAGHNSNNDSGVTNRLLGMFLGYLQDANNNNFFACTANNISQLPPELLRKGRFDEIWFINTPTPSDRLQIIKIHLPEQYHHFNLDKINEYMTDFTGAEIENCIQQALRQTFYEDTPLTEDIIINQAQQIKPLCSIKKEELQELVDKFGKQIRQA
jgi:ATP-dependent 26S proteasome regulatory subunit